MSLATLDILIPTLPDRADSLAALLAELRRQDPAVRILTDDRLGITIGEKRGHLHARATADYVAMIDDDDWIAPDYLARVHQALLTWPDVCGITLHYCTDGRDFGLYRHSWRFRENWQWTGTERTPHHLCPLRRTHAQAIHWRHENWGEDYNFAMGLHERLARDPHTREAWTGDDPIYFYRHTTAKPAPIGHTMSGGALVPIPPDPTP